MSDAPPSPTESPTPLDPRRIAVLLNVHAKNVKPKVWYALTKVLDPEQVLLSTSLQEAWEVAGQVIDGGYGTVLTGGGDGTFMGFLNAVLDRHEIAAHQGRVSATPPRFGLLKLGTGNAVAGYVGASPASAEGLQRDVERVRSGEVDTLPLDLLLTEGVRTPFVGMGIDAAIINDYKWVRGNLGKGPLGALTEGGIGYTLAIGGRTVPTYALAKESPIIRIVNRGEPAQRLGAGGEPVGEPIGEGEVLFEGEAKIIAASTVPCYGYNMKLFPYADKAAGRMHLRASNESVGGILRNLARIWKGEFSSEQIWDYLLTDVEIISDKRELPFQVGGDAAGYRNKVRFRVLPEPVQLLRFED